MERMNRQCVGFAKFALTAAVMLQSSLSLASWVSGGGEMFSDKTNPWFLENTKVVRYCIKIDEANFGQTAERAEESIRTAFNYWKKQFAYADQAIEERPDIATQEFVLKDCVDPGVKISFQFGVLDEKQKAFIGKVEKTIGASVRTDYNTQSMAGEGFVYISPESGKFALDGKGLYGDIIEERWKKSNGRILDLVLIHEMGHIFGLQHSPGIMAFDTPGYLISKPFGDLIIADAPLPSFFMGKDLHGGYYGEFKYKGLEDFGVPSNAVSYQIKQEGYGHLLHYKLEEDGPLILAGSFKAGGHNLVDYESPVVLYVPENQKAFDELKSKNGQLIPYHFASKRVFATSFKGEEGVKLDHVFLTVHADEIEISGVNAAGKAVSSFYSASAVWTRSTDYFDPKENTKFEQVP